MRIFAIFSLLLACAGLSEAQIGSAGIGGFGGPSVLGRGTSSGGGRGSEAGFRFYAGVTGTYDTGLTGFALDANGNVQNAGSKGVEGMAGVYGSKRSRRTLISLNYQAGYRQFTNIRGFNGTDQNITASVSKQLNSRAAFGLGVNAGTTNRAFGLNALNGFIDPNLIGFGVPTAEIFDNRIYYGSASANYIWQKSSRSSLNLLGNVFATRRSGNVLFGANGAGAGADYGYRLSRNQVISVGYNYFLFKFTRGFGDSQGHALSVGYGTRVARKYDFAVRLGATRLESLFLQRVDVDPVIAAIVGITSTQTVAHNVGFLPNAGLSFSGPLTRRSTFGLSAGLFVLPGNGVISTSRNWNGGFNYNYTGIRRLGLGGSLFYNKISSVVGQAQTFSSVNGSASVSSRVAGDVFASFNAGLRRFLEGQTNNFQRNSYFVSLGLFWSPGDTPLNFR
jgi:hypothetical protein